MVMVRLNHVTTRFDPLQYQARLETTLYAPQLRFREQRAGARPFNRPRPTLQGTAKPVGATVLDDLSLTVLHGETLSVIGPSGCGKSTLLRVIAGLIRLASGEVYFDGQPVNALSPRDRRVGMVFQNYALYPHMAVADNMGFFWRLRHRRKQEISSKVQQTARLLQLDVGALLGRFPRHLSGGEQQRVAVGRCLSREPTVFLLDEPFSNLDAHLRERSRRDVKKLLAMFAVTTVFVTHDQQEATAMGDRLAVMREGRIVQIGTYREMYEDPHDSFVAGFLGDPPISLLTCHYHADSQLLVGEGQLEIPLDADRHSLEPNQAVLLGVRPERVTLTSASDNDAVRGRISHFEPRIGERLKILYVNLAPEVVSVKVPYETPVTIGEAVGLHLDPAGLLLFDAQTHRRLALLSPS
jgi:ABC-type sugar transport system ATPase subunit